MVFPNVKHLHAITTSQQWSSLSILADDIATLEWIFSKDAWRSNSGRDDEKKSHDGEGLDPLYGNDDGEELGDTEGCVE
jgi:hypothetical protein